MIYLVDNIYSLSMMYFNSVDVNEKDDTDEFLSYNVKNRNILPLL